MATACIPQVTFGFEPKGKPIVAPFDQPHASSDGGAVLLKSLDTQLQLTKRLAGCLVDRAPAGQGAASDRWSWCGSASSGSPVATPTATTPRGWPTTRSTSCCSTAIRSPGRPWPRSRPCRASRTPWRGRPLRDMAHVLADTVIETHRRRLKGRATPDHDRSRPHRRPDPRPAGVHLLQRPLRHVVLPAARGDGDLQRRARAVCGGRGAAAGQRAGDAGGAGAPAAPAGQAARRLSRRRRIGCGWMGASPTPKLFQFLEQQQVEYVVAMASNRAPGEARAAADGPGPDAVQGHRADGAPVWRDAVRRAELDAQAAGDHQGRGRAASRARSEEQPPLRGDQPARRARRRSTSSTAGGATWRTGSRNCITGWSWTGPVASGSWPTSSGCC